MKFGQNFEQMVIDYVNLFEQKSLTFIILN